MSLRSAARAFVVLAVLLAGCGGGPSFEERRAAGIEAYKNQQFEEAEETLFALSAEDPRDFETRYYLARTFAATGNFARAVDEWDAVLLLRPAFAEAHYRRGNALVNMHRTEDALASWGEASRLNPNYTEAHYNQAKAYEELEEYNRAVEKYVEAIGADSTFYPAQFGLAYLLERAEQNDLAAPRYFAAMRIDTTQAAAHMGYIRTLHASGRAADALTELERFIETRNPQPPLSDSLEVMRESLRREAGSGR